jgi:hypothetical protein
VHQSQKKSYFLAGLTAVPRKGDSSGLMVRKLVNMNLLVNERIKKPRHLRGLYPTDYGERLQVFIAVVIIKRIKPGVNSKNYCGYEPDKCSIWAP